MRFHFGVSLSWRKIKKYLIPILIGILLGFFGQFLNILTVYAAQKKVENLNTTYNFQMYTYDNYNFNQKIFNDLSIYQFLNEYVNKDFSNHYTLITFNDDWIFINLVERRSNYNFGFSIYGYNDSDLTYIQFLPIDTHYIRTPPNTYTWGIKIGSSSNPFNTQAYQNFKNCSENNNCSKTGLYDENSYTWEYTTNFNNIFRLSNQFPDLVVSNDDSYNFQHYLYSNSLYWTNIQFIYYDVVTDASTSPKGNAYFKKVIINGHEMQPGDNIPMAYTGSTPPIGGNELPTWSNTIPNLYFNVGPTDISTFNYSFNFKSSYNSSEYIDNLNYNINFYGKINNTDYYSYEKISCSFSNTNFSYSNGINTLNFNGITCSSDLSNYVNISGNILFYGLDNINTSIYDIETGFYYLNGPVYDIYEHFTNLLEGQSLSISCNKPRCYGNIYSSNDFSFYQSYDLKGNKSTLSSSRYSNPTPIIYGIDVNKFYIIYSRSSSSNNFDLLFSKDSIYGINYTQDNSFHYFDENGDVTSSIIDDYNSGTSNSDYDISYYMSIVSNCIYNLSDDIYEFSVIVQNFYNSIPIGFQNLIFIFFILGNVMITYKLIRK